MDCKSQLLNQSFKSMMGFRDSRAYANIKTKVMVDENVYVAESMNPN